MVEWVADTEWALEWALELEWELEWELELELERDDWNNLKLIFNKDWVEDGII